MKRTDEIADFAGFLGCGACFGFFALAAVVPEKVAAVLVQMTAWIGEALV